MRRAQAAMWIVIVGVLVVGSGAVSGCAEPQEDEGAVTETKSDLVGGSVTSDYPGIGQIDGPFTYCTATLISPRWIITAAHCINFSTVSPAPSAYTFYPGQGTGTSNSGVVVQQLFNLGPTWTGGGQAPWGMGSSPFTYVSDSTGNNDIALAYLATAAPSNVGTLTLAGSPGWIPMPAIGTTVSQYGFGSTVNFLGGGGATKSVKNWPYSLPTGSGTSIIHYVDGGNIADGDSGGPVLVGVLVSAIWGVNSQGFQGVFPWDIFGAVAFYQGSLCSIMNATPHTACHTGAPLVPLPNTCVPFYQKAAPQPIPGRPLPIRPLPQNTTSIVCGLDPYCCTTNDAWDGICVSEAQTYMTAADWQACITAP